MGNLFTVKIKWSTSHLFFPTIIAWILVILAVIMVIQRAIKCKKEKKPFFNFSNFHFFNKGYDKLKLWGAIILFAGYIACLEPMGFLWASILFVFLLNVLFAESIRMKAIFHKDGTAIINWRSLAGSAIISVVSSVLLWYVFGIVFNITLP